MSTVMNWMQANSAVYFGNATATRDFRVQLRGNRSVMLFGAYLILLIGVAMIVYAEATSDRGVSVVDAQAHLQSFYQAVLGMLGGTICLVAPALCATTVVAERQRRSFDLIFSAPVTPKYYLVGKMISTYRYIWMLLVLSIPVTATCVMLGGASWSDVLGSYAMLSLQSLVLTSLALMVSTFAAKPVAAVFMSYGICLPAVIGISIVSQMALGVSGVSHSMEAPFFVTLDPFSVMTSIGTHTTIGSWSIPNWVLGVVAALAVTKIALLCAGSLLSPTGSEARSLRTHMLVYSTVGLGLLGYGLYGTVAYLADPSAMVGRVFFWTFMPLCAIVPFMTCYGLDGENRLRPNGIFKLRGMLSPSPATALPFLWTLLGFSAVGMLGGYLLAAATPNASTLISHGPSMFMRTTAGSTSFDALPATGPTLSASFFAYVLFTMALWTFMWSIGRFSSALSLGIRTARGITFSGFLLLVAAPIPVLLVLEMWQGLPTGSGLWSLWALRSVVSASGDAPATAATYTVILLLLALPISFYSETKLKEIMEKRKAKTEKAAVAA